MFYNHFLLSTFICLFSDIKKEIFQWLRSEYMAAGLIVIMMGLFYCYDVKISFFCIIVYGFCTIMFTNYSIVLYSNIVLYFVVILYTLISYMR